MKEVSRRDLMAAGAGLLPLVGLAAAAAAQDAGTATTTTTRRAEQGQGRAQGAADDAALDSQDPSLAACLLIAGKKQIDVCRFALDKIQNDEVKAFAQAEIEEHETLKKKLEGLGYQYPTAPESRAAAAGAGAGAGAIAGADGGGAGAGEGNARQAARALAVGRTVLPPSAAELILIDHEVARQCVATTEAEQSKLKGLDFDKRFVGSQLDAHYGLFDHGVVFRKHATREMAPVLDEARPIIERHIATCKELMEKLDKMKQEKQ